MNQVTAIVIGAGMRGITYSNYAIDCPDKLKIVGVAEPGKFRRKKMASRHGIAADNIFHSWKEAAAREKFADCVFITTQDRMHREPAVAFAEKGYNILLEKPIAVTYKDCCDIVDACSRNHVILATCHGAPYSPIAQKAQQLIDSGVIGDIISVQHLQPIGFHHFAHSYVRGNWRNSEQSSFSLLAKSCHDIELVRGWMGTKKPTSVSSYGSLKHFKAENKPPGASGRCLDCSVEAECPYSAKKIYINDSMKQLYGKTDFMQLEIITDVIDIENVTEALRSGPYGRCVYECDNNVVDNQVVNIEFEGGATVSILMVAFTEEVCTMQSRIFGTKGEISCEFKEKKVSQFDFLTRKRIDHDLTEVCSMLPESRKTGHHGDTDFYIVKAFVEAVAKNDHSFVLTGADDTLATHFLCFAAEKARLDRCVIDLTIDVDVDDRKPPSSN